MLIPGGYRSKMRVVNVAAELALTGRCESLRIRIDWIGMSKTLIYENRFVSVRMPTIRKLMAMSPFADT